MLTLLTATKKERHKVNHEIIYPTVMMYQVHCMSVVSELHSTKTGKGLMEQFFEEQGVKLTTFRKYENNAGQTFMIGEDGRSLPVKKPVPRYIRAIQ